MRRWALLAVLPFIVLPAPARAAAPCPGPSDLCPPTSGVTAACVSASVVVEPAGVVLGRSEASISGTEGYEHVRAQVTEQGIGTPVIATGRAIESACGAFLFEGAPEGCGKAQAGDVNVDLRPHMDFFMTANGLLSQGCTRRGTPGFNEFDLAHLSVNGRGLIVEGGRQNQGGDAAGIEVFTNENTRTIVGACTLNQGAGARIVAGDVTVLLGWVATIAC